jgi:hypothetical protein
MAVLQHNWVQQDYEYAKSIQLIQLLKADNTGQRLLGQYYRNYDGYQWQVYQTRNKQYPIPITGYAESRCDAQAAIIRIYTSSF